jgi:hypothetical protein
VQAVVEIAGVAAIACVELWAAVPAGLAMGLPAPVVWAATVCGALAAVVVVVFGGERLRAWVMTRCGRDRAPVGGRLRRVWQRYGVVGWGLTAPLVVGVPLAALVGVTLGAPRRWLLVWLASGVVLWTTALTVALALGVDELRSVV